MSNIERARQSLADHGGVEEEAFARFSSLLRYVDGDYRDPSTFKRIREAYFEERKKTVHAAVSELLRLVTGNENVLSADAKKRARTDRSPPS